MAVTEKGKVSLIIPVYNVAGYLRECVDSSINQTYKNMEIILVDDGSTDDSGKICDEYEKKDSRITVIHKKNGGLSDARNVGLEKCSGDIIAFLDSDDYISPYFMEIMTNVMYKDGCDVVALNWGTDFWDGETQPELAKDAADFKYKAVSEKEALKLMLYQNIATGAPFKIYKREIFNNIIFPVGYLYEDVATTYKTFINAGKIGVVDAKLYAYRKRRDSIIRSKFSEKKLICLKISDELSANIAAYDKSLEKAAASRGFAMIFSVFLQVPPDDKQTQKKVWEKIKALRPSVLSDNCKIIRKKNKYGAYISLLGMKVSYYLGRKFGQKGSMN